MKKPAGKILLGSLFAIFLLFFAYNRFYYEEPTTEMDVSARASEENGEVHYYLESNFIPKAKYRLGVALWLPVEEDAFLVENLKETSFRADKHTEVFELTLSVDVIKEAILAIEDVNLTKEELVEAAENWRDYEYFVNMSRRKFFKTYNSVGLPTTVK